MQKLHASSLATLAVTQKSERAINRPAWEIEEPPRALHATSMHFSQGEKN